MRAIALALTLAVAGCFSPDNPACAFQCGSFNNFDCPENYSCNKSDGYCHLNGSTDPCPFVTSEGGSGDGAIDMSMSPDQSTDDGAVTDDGGGDMSMPGDDGGQPDLEVPDLETPDLQMPDLQMPDLEMPDLEMPDLAISCGNGKRDGLETDVDCGGATCVGLGKTCALGKMCMAQADCTSGSCDLGDGSVPGVCQ